MRVIVAGGRSQILSANDREYLDELCGLLGVTEIVSGKATGVDTCGEQWAAERGMAVRRFPARWYMFGKTAGFKRNFAMADYADALVAFPGGSGTDHMVLTATKIGLTVFDRR